MNELLIGIVSRADVILVSARYLLMKVMAAILGLVSSHLKFKAPPRSTNGYQTRQLSEKFDECWTWIPLKMSKKLCCDIRDFFITFIRLLLDFLYCILSLIEVLLRLGCLSKITPPTTGWPELLTVICI